MLDRLSLRLLDPVLQTSARFLAARGVRPDQLTITAFLIGLLGACCIAFSYYLSGLVLILLNRLGDGVDGPLARLSRATDRGAYLDIVLDFIFYSAIVFAFALADPPKNALPAAALIFTFVGTGASFLAFAILAERRSITSLRLPDKGFYYLGGLAEGTETVIFMVLCCLFPAFFPLLAWVFAAICLGAAAVRVIYGYLVLR
jgi:phosphatidylglycerophosphate synthase